MAKVFIEETSLENIGNAIRQKNGETDKYSPATMAEKIQTIPVGDFQRYYDFIQGDLEVADASFFGPVTKIRDGLFEYDKKLREITFPEGVTVLGQYSCRSEALKKLYLPASLTEIKTSMMQNGCDVYLKGETPPTISESSFTKNQLKLHIPAKYFNNYLQADIWNTVYVENLVPDGKYASVPLLKGVIEFGKAKTFNIKLVNFGTEAPVYSIVPSQENFVDISSRVENSEIIFDIMGKNTEGPVTVKVSVNGDDGFVFEYNIEINVVAKIEPPTFEVVPMEGANYGFELNSEGYYESQNKGVGSSAALCKVLIHNPGGLTIFVDCINEGESNYDYGLLSLVNKEMSTSYSDDTTGLFYSFKGLSKPGVIQTISYNDAVGDCFITVKFRKDGSGDQPRDMLMFKMRY